MIEVPCNRCKREVEVNFYFFDSVINSEENFLSNQLAYLASAKGRAICPRCGTTIERTFSQQITHDDIVKFAQGGKVIL